MKSSSGMLIGIMGKWRKIRKKGHFAVYTKEGKRFVVPLCYLNHPIFRVLLEMAEEEFGTAARGPLQVPCEEEFMEYVLSLLRKKKKNKKMNQYRESSKNGLVSMNSFRGAAISSLFPIFQSHQSQGARGGGTVVV